MSINSDLAQAARRVNALADRMPEVLRPDIAAEWSALSSEIKGLPENEARAVVVDWLSEMEKQCDPNFIARPDPRTRV